MADFADICILGASQLVDGVPLWQGVIPVANDNDDVEPLGESEVFQALGVTSLPYPKDENGYAEAVALRNVGGRNVVYVGARDTRTAKIVGNMKPGDTVIHSTGPRQAAQLQLKEEKQQAVLTTKSSAGKTMMVILDGKNDKVQITGLGAIIEIDKSGDVSIANKGGASILLQGSDIHLLGNVKLPGMNPGMVLVQSLPIVQPSGAVLAAPLSPVLGVGK